MKKLFQHVRQATVALLNPHFLHAFVCLQKVSRMKSKDNIRKGLYEILDWLERERSQRVREFWSCVFKDTILNQYPTLKLLRNSLMDGQSLVFS